MVTVSPFSFHVLRRSNGSQLASLLKVHLQLRGFTVFIDIEKLEAGKFDENLLNSVRAAKHFLLVLTPKALDRCIGDDEQNDWVHKEIATALQSECNIIPITDDFEWPQPESLPEDIRKVSHPLFRVFLTFLTNLRHTAQSHQIFYSCTFESIFCS